MRTAVRYAAGLAGILLAVTAWNSMLFSMHTSALHRIHGSQLLRHSLTEMDMDQSLDPSPHEQHSIQQTIAGRKFGALDFDTCKARLKTRFGTTSPPKKLHRVVWMHFPKTGSSFGALLHNYLCEDDGRAQDDDDDKVNSIGFNPTCVCEQKNTTMWDPELRRVAGLKLRHKTCVQGITTAGLFASHETEAWRGPGRFEANRGAYVAMFRDPLERLASAFRHGKHAWGLPRRAQPDLAKVTTIEQFVAFPGIQGCQTKMVNGHFCAAHEPVNATNAVQRLKDFAFVGLTSHWNHSVCLFHHMWGGPLHENEFINIRPNPTEDSHTLASTLDPNTDPHDRLLYHAAEALFAERLAAFDLT